MASATSQSPLLTIPEGGIEIVIRGGLVQRADKVVTNVPEVRGHGWDFQSAKSG
jgi:hypothetical protein